MQVVSRLFTLLNWLGRSERWDVLYWPITMLVIIVVMGIVVVAVLESDENVLPANKLIEVIFYVCLCRHHLERALIIRNWKWKYKVYLTTPQLWTSTGIHWDSNCVIDKSINGLLFFIIQYCTIPSKQYSTVILFSLEPLIIFSVLAQAHSSRKHSLLLEKVKPIVTIQSAGERWNL